MSEEAGKPPKRFMLFNHKYNKPAGGLYDVTGTYHTRAGVIKALRTQEKEKGWYNGTILDRKTGEVFVSDLNERSWNVIGKSNQENSSTL